jgi:hypothetical protein
MGSCYHCACFLPHGSVYCLLIMRGLPSGDGFLETSSVVYPIDAQYGLSNGRALGGFCEQLLVSIEPSTAACGVVLRCQARVYSGTSWKEGRLLGLTVEQRPIRRVHREKSDPPQRRRQPRREPYSQAGDEPRIEDILNDPLTEAVMRRDGVSEDSLRALIRNMRSSLRARPLHP